MGYSNVNGISLDSTRKSPITTNNTLGIIMKKILFAMLIISPLGALADHIDVIEVALNEGCSLSTYVAIKDDFNSQWGARNGYQSEVLFPIQSNDLATVYWVGRSANAAAFGNAWDVWSKDLADPNSIASKLWARFLDCSTNVSRRGYDVY